MRSLPQVLRTSSFFLVLLPWLTASWVLILLLGSGPQAQKPVLLKDINLTPLNNPSSDPTDFATLGGITCFAATTKKEGRELWRSDGTTKGTTLLVDIAPGPTGSDPKDLLVVGNLIFFTAWDEAHGRELWQSDGTNKGTVLVSDLRLGKAGSGIREMTVLGKALFFVADDGKSGLELWKNTATGTVLVADIDKGARGSDPQFLEVSGSGIFFTADEPSTGRELWRSDGTSKGTVLVADLVPGRWGASPNRLTGTPSSLFFMFASELWKSDGTSKGTIKIQKASWGYITELISLGNRLVFTATSSSSSQVGLYVTDGTLSTMLLKPVFARWIMDLKKVGSMVFFNVMTGQGIRIWKTDGTSKNTALVKSGQALQVASFGKKIAILAAHPSSLQDFDLWLSDGTAKGTVLATSFKNPNPKMYSRGSELYFVMDDGKLGRELWIGKGKLKAITLLKDIQPAWTTAGSSPALLGRVGPWLLFTANDGVNGTELWRTDGTTNGTSLIKDIRPGAAGSSFGSSVLLGDQVLFTLDDGKTGGELWRSDGTAKGTYLVKDINPGRASSYPRDFTRVGHRAFFIAYTVSTGKEIWVSDGTKAGTRLVVDLMPGKQSSWIFQFVSFRDHLFFIFPLRGYWLYRSDGTAKGTVKVSPPGLWLADPWTVSPTRSFAVYRGHLYFLGQGRGTGKELWRTDGTMKGTKIVKDSMPGLGGNSPENFLVVNDLLYFSGRDPNHGRELWKSDGTAAGTSMVLDVLPGTQSSNPYPMMGMGDDLLFWAITPKAALWRTRGTAATTLGVTKKYGTYTLRGESSSRRAWFVGYDSQGSGLWTTDGTSQGTKTIRWMRGRSTEGPESSMIRLFNGKLIFTSWDAIRGSELWMLDPGATSHPRGLACSSTALLPGLKSGDPVVGGTMLFSGVNAPNAALALLILGRDAKTPVQFTPSCSLYFDPALFYIHSAFLTRQDSWRRSLFLPNNASLIGVQALAQALFFSASTGLAVTPGQLLTLGR